MKTREREPTKSASFLIKVALVAVAGTSWAAHSFPAYSAFITLFAGIVTAVASGLAFKIASGNRVNCDDGSEKLSEGDAHVPVSGDPVNVAEDLLETALDNGNSVHGDFYWKIAQHLASTRDKNLSDKVVKGNFEFTLNIVNLYVQDGNTKHSRERDRDRMKEFILRPDLEDTFRAEIHH